MPRRIQETMLSISHGRVFSVGGLSTALIVLVILLYGCAPAASTSSSEMSLSESVAMKHAEMSSKAQNALQKFEKKVGPGISQKKVSKIASRIKWLDGMDVEKSFKLKGEKEIVEKKYNFYRKKAVLVFKNDRLVSLTKEKNEPVIELEKDLKEDGRIN